MQAIGGPQKLRFTIHFCSGEDPDYPVQELLQHNPSTRGWQSPRFCKFPQELVLLLEQPSKVQQIQILSHEYKIASRVEVYVLTPTNGDATPDNCTIKRLGYLSFDSNERSNHQARELKSVHVNVYAALIRLVIHRCHVNKLNIYNQVGIIALNLIGEPSPPSITPHGYLATTPASAMAMSPYYNHSAAAMADLNLDINVDPETAAKIRDLQLKKDAAVQREDYDEAKRLKQCIERLKVVGQKVAQLVARKRAAVEREDYDLAKSLKEDIDKLRLAGESAAGLLDSDVPVPHEAAAATSGLRSNGEGPPEHHVSRPVSAVIRRDPEGSKLSPESSGYSGISVASPRAVQAQTSKGTVAYDERPVRGRGAYTLDDAGAEGTSSAVAPGRTRVSDDAEVVVSKPPHDWPEELPTPEAISQAPPEASSITDLVGEYVAASLFSRDWQLRDAALTWILKQVQTGQLIERRDAQRMLIKVAVRGIKDNVPNVFMSGLNLVHAASAAFGARETAATVEQCLPLLIEKLGDNNSRAREAARDAILQFAQQPETGIGHLTHLFLKPVKNQSAWRPILATLQVLQALVPMLGISKSGDGFDLAELMDYVGKAFNSANADVRSTAVKVTQAVHALVGSAVRKYLPKDVNPKIKEQLEAAYGGVAESPPPLAAEPSSSKRAPNRTKSASSTRNSTSKANSTGAKPSGASTQQPSQSTYSSPQPSHPPQPQQHSPPQQPPQQSYQPKDTPKAAAAPSQAAAQSPVKHEGEVVSPSDETYPYLEQLKVREKQLGANHPDVAESCTNLAILYNQRGDYNRAQPLYERALKIYESAYGPDHPDVAHTLTDLAVLHLEQGHDEVGRPLLERALVIQEKNLGPDHPDVLAIKDVLYGED